MAQDRISYRSGDIREWKRKKSGNLEFAPPECIAFLGQQAEEKKLIVRKSSLCLPLLESKRLFFLFNHWPRYERSREVPIWKDFQIILFGVAVRFVYIFSSPPLPFDTYKEQRTERAKRQKYGKGEQKF